MQRIVDNLRQHIEFHQLYDVEETAFQNLIIFFAVLIIMHLASSIWIVVSPTLKPYAYDKALYWTLVTMTTTGFGDITAHTTPQAIVAVIVMFAGASL